MPPKRGDDPEANHNNTDINIMGNYIIIIEGVGSHQNGDTQSDADLLLTQFLETLRGAGQTIEHASFRSIGRRETLTLVGKKKTGAATDSAEREAGLIDKPLPGHPGGASVALLEAAHEKLDTLLEIAFLEAKKSTLKKIEGGGDSEEEAEKLKAKAKAEETPPTPDAPEADPEKKEGAGEAEAEPDEPQAEEGNTQPA